MKNQQTSTPEVLHTFATHSSLVHDVTDTDCCAQDGSVHSHDFAHAEVTGVCVWRGWIHGGGEYQGELHL